MTLLPAAKDGDQTVTRLAQVQTGSSTLQRSADEESVNTATHGLGLAAAVGGGLVMAADLAARGEVRLMAGCGAYLASLIAVYGMSTLSHYATAPNWKSFFRRLDQAFIYLLIAGTYTPYSLAYLRGDHWWALMVVMWAIALAGCASKMLFAHRVEAVSVTSYVLLAWIPIVAIPTLWHSSPLGAFETVIAGGACYMVGTLFLVNDERYRYFHAVWHLCVIAGSTCHFYGILVYVVRGGS